MSALRHGIAARAPVNWRNDKGAGDSRRPHFRFFGLRKLALTLRDAVTAAAFLILAALIAARLDGETTERLSGPFRVSDGDTLSLDGSRYRLEGIDAPETMQTCGARGAEWRCGEAARDALKALVASGAVACSGRDLDRYGRLLVACRVGGLDLSAEMVRQGMAIAYGGADVDYRREEAEARSARRGLWSGAFDRPQDWRRDGFSVSTRHMNGRIEA